MKRAYAIGAVIAAGSVAVLGGMSASVVPPRACGVCCPCVMCPAQSGAGGAVDARTAEALRTTLMDERRVGAFYEGVLARHGQVRPFANIVRAEARHAAAIEAAMERHGLAVPTDRPGDVPEVPGTIAECRLLAARAERENIAMYDLFLEDVTEPDIRLVFENLREASRRGHLAAFERGPGSRAGASPMAGRGGREGRRTGRDRPGRGTCIWP
ncbi:MAG: DUF2202 domain-containing protein [Phycisphaerales bacterium]|nr:DUF2202 domain-containing protein [Phycisphaerales bacterium]